MHIHVITAMARPPHTRLTSAMWGVLALVALLGLVSCGDDTQAKRKDAAPAQPYDAASVDSTSDRPAVETPAGCLSNGHLYSVGQVFLVIGSCPAPSVCQCIGPGEQSCLSSCPVDGSAPVDRLVADAPLTVTCASGGRSYQAGENVPADGTCRGACVCMADGTLAHCSGTCADAATMPIADAPRGRDSAPDRNERDAPTSDISIVPYDGALDRSAVDRAGIDRGGVDRATIDGAVDRTRIDGNCAVGAPCTLANGNEGICPSGTCRACTGASDDNACVAAYGTGTICVSNQCVIGACHDSKGCTGKKLCDANHTCQSCTTDQQCKTDTSYGNNTICVSGQCVTGTCHNSGDCQGKRVCNATTHACVNCTADTDCRNGGYGATGICVSGQCEIATCTTNAQCTTWNRVCDAAGSGACAPCTADAQCQSDTTNYGTGYTCVSGQCASGTCTSSASCASNGRICAGTGANRACVTCANDTQCKNDPRYGSSTLCLKGACTTGNCHDISADCTAGRLCGLTAPHTCGDCTTDAQCIADARYGNGYICVASLCVRGDCHDDSDECTEGLLCGRTTAHTCGPCSTSDQCKSDERYGAATMCATTAGATAVGHCISNACDNNGSPCAANVNDLCCDNTCVSGNCCEDADCASLGEDYSCRRNTCSRCDSASGTSVVVDPVQGDDTATGSGRSGGAVDPACSFRTVTHALSAIRSTGGTVTIVGSNSGSTTLFTGSGDGYELLPIEIPPNVTVTTASGPIRLPIASTSIGFRLLGDQAKLTPAPDAPLTIDVADHRSGAAIVVAIGTTGTASIANVTIVGPGGDGIEVHSGGLDIGPGVQVTGAGTVDERRSGLAILGGAVTITVGATDPATLFEDNTESGISVSGTGVLTIKGASTSAGLRSVVASRNANDNVAIRPSWDANAPLNDIDGLYSDGSVNRAGLLIQAGSHVMVRNSIFQGNAGDGIHIASGGTAPGANDLGTIDLGRSGADGRNVLQVGAGNGPNGGAGLCVEVASDAVTGVLRAWGNQFAEIDCSATSPGAVQVSTTCTGAVDLGLVTSGATVETFNCTQ